MLAFDAPAVLARDRGATHPAIQELYVARHYKERKATGAQGSSSQASQFVWQTSR